MWLNKVGEFAFNPSKQEKTWALPQRNRGVRFWHQRKPVKSKKKGIGFGLIHCRHYSRPVAIGLGTPIATGRELSKLDRGSKK